MEEGTRKGQHAPSNPHQLRRLSAGQLPQAHGRGRLHTIYSTVEGFEPSDRETTPQRIAAMAIDLHRVKPAVAARKQEAFVERQLARARARIRYLDLAAAALGLVILTLAYGLVLALCDRWLELPVLARQIGFALYAAGGLVYLRLLVLRPLWRPITPYYAARRLERAVPEA